MEDKNDNSDTGVQVVGPRFGRTSGLFTQIELQKNTAQNPSSTTVETPN